MVAQLSLWPEAETYWSTGTCPYGNAAPAGITVPCLVHQQSTSTQVLHVLHILVIVLYYEYYARATFGLSVHMLSFQPWPASESYRYGGQPSVVQSVEVAAS